MRSLKPLTLLLSVGYLSGALATSSPLNDPKDRISYSIGADIGKNFHQQDIDIKIDPFIQGIKDGQKDQLTLMKEEEVRETIMSLQQDIMKKQNEIAKALAEENLEKSKAFLTQNKKNVGVTTLKSGLQYKVIKEGQGAPPSANDRVVTHYRGTLIDGSKFDSSYDRGEPVDFAVKGVIPGWTEALQLMKPGAKWKLFIPPHLAYGEHGMGNKIAPNSTLIFEIELLKVERLS